MLKIHRTPVLTAVEQKKLGDKNHGCGAGGKNDGKCGEGAPGDQKRIEAAKRARLPPTGLIKGNAGELAQGERGARGAAGLQPSVFGNRIQIADAVFRRVV